MSHRARTGLALLVVPLAGCALQVPAADPSLGGEGAALTLRDIQDESAAEHPDVGARVQVRSVVVTGVDRFDEDGTGETGTVFVQEIGGGPRSGIQLFAPAIQPAGEPLRAGDVADIEGTYLEFELGQINPAWADPTGRTVSQIADGVVRKTGEWLAPEPVRLEHVADIVSDPDAEGWEGVLVEIRDVEAAGAQDRYGSFTVTGGAVVGNDNYSIPGVQAGTRFARLAGVLSYLYDYTLLPRAAQDVEIDETATAE